MANDTMPAQKEGKQGLKRTVDWLVNVVCKPTLTIHSISETAEPPAVKKPRMTVPAATTSSTPPTHTEAEVAAMSARQYMDELVVPTLLRALASVNKEVRSIVTPQSSNISRLFIP